MLKHRWTDRICCIVLAFTLLLTAVFLYAASAGVVTEKKLAGYAERLFDTSRVHTIDIVMDDWDGFLETCVNEEYSSCTVVIDGKRYANVGIRAKGNTSLSSVASYGNNRYSFKIEFDHYVKGKSYYGLDKLCLNNIIQDNTYMKDYLAYTLMNKMGVSSPLCSYVSITVNGKEWGLYLAVEAVEDAFLSRNFSGEIGKLYKPDSMSFGGGRGNGRDFDMDNFRDKFDFRQDELRGDEPPMGSEGFGGAGNADVQLQYIDDNPASYSNIFDNAKTEISEADQARLIASLKSLSEGDTSVVDQEEVLRYMAVHNFLCNDDSYTGIMVHNYYLYEKNGVLSMIPWDYNLSMGGMDGGFGNSNASSTVNAPIDTLVSSVNITSRPMAAWIFASEETQRRYHEVYAEFVQGAIDEGWLTDEVQTVVDMISPYVEKDPTAFCTFDEFKAGASALERFCKLRLQSVAGQLDGSIPSSSEAQMKDASNLIDTGDLSLSDMGGMNDKGFGGNDANMGEFFSMDGKPDFGVMPPQGGQMPDMGDRPQMGGQMPDFSPSNGAPSQPDFGNAQAVDGASGATLQGGQSPEFGPPGGAQANNRTDEMPPAIESDSQAFTPVAEKQPDEFVGWDNAPTHKNSIAWPYAIASLLILLFGIIFVLTRKSHN